MGSAEEVKGRRDRKRRAWGLLRARVAGGRELLGIGYTYSWKVGGMEDWKVG